jgi:hypothetical protein
MEETILGIAVINESSLRSTLTFRRCCHFYAAVDQDLLPTWGLDNATLTFVPKSTKPASGKKWALFLDDSETKKPKPVDVNETY